MEHRGLIVDEAFQVDVQGRATSYRVSTSMVMVPFSYLDTVALLFVDHGRKLLDGIAPGFCGIFLIR